LTTAVMFLPDTEDDVFTRCWNVVLTSAVTFLTRR
jgi:hypothetical protein